MNFEIRSRRAATGPCSITVVIIMRIVIVVITAIIITAVIVIIRSGAIAVGVIAILLVLRDGCERSTIRYLTKMLHDNRYGARLGTY